MLGAWRAVTVMTVVLTSVGCATSAHSDFRFGYEEWREGIGSRRVDTQRVIYPFATTPEMESWAADFRAQHATMTPLGRLKKLQRSLFDKSEFPFAYDERLTLTGAEAFETRRGNCMAFTAMFVALSRAMGAQTFLVSVRRAPEVEKEESLVVVNRHVVAGYVDSGQMNLFDFYITSDLPYMTQRVIDDVRASSMFHTNLGGAAIREGDLEGALEHLEIAVAIDPQLSAAWVNLGVARSRTGDTDGAIEAYERAVATDPGNSSALTNLAYVYRHLGQEEQARNALLAAVRQGSTAFTLIALADAEMTRGNLDKARGYLFRARRMERQQPEVYDALARLARLADDPSNASRYRRRADKLRSRQLAAPNSVP
jgi:Flp pilus assembly protein TadD